MASYLFKALLLATLTVGLKTDSCLGLSNENSASSPPAPLLHAWSGKQAYVFMTPSKWYKANPKKEDLAPELNDIYHLVGMPASLVLNLFGHSHSDGKSAFFSTLGPYQSSILEIQYTENGDSVSRFRFVERTEQGYRPGLYSQWQTENLNGSGSGDEGERVRPSPLELTSSCKKFEKHLWESTFDKRKRMVWDITHSYYLVGTEKDTIHSLLGHPDQAEHFGPTSESEYFRLSTGSNDCAGVPIDCLEVRFCLDKVWGARISQRNDIK